MKNLKILMLVMGFALISACASNETMDTAESDAKAEAEKMKEEKSAEMEAEKAKAEAEMAAKKEKAEADMKAKEAEMKMKADQAAADAEAKARAEAAAMEESARSASSNQVSTCTNGDAVRVITVVNDNPETDTICEVTYEKSTGVQTLWSANNDSNYCVEQAKAFVEKQEGWGWNCSNME